MDINDLQFMCYVYIDHLLLGFPYTFIWPGDGFFFP